MKRRKRISLIMAMLMFCNLIPANIQTDIANAAGTEIADDEMEDVLAIRAYLLGLLPGEESLDINGDGCINAVDLTLAKRRAMGFSPPELKPLRSDGRFLQSLPLQRPRIRDHQNRCEMVSRKSIL